MSRSAVAEHAPEVRRMRDDPTEPVNRSGKEPERVEAIDLRVKEFTQRLLGSHRA